jgi:hypothetical protein
MHSLVSQYLVEIHLTYVRPGWDQTLGQHEPRLDCAEANVAWDGVVIVERPHHSLLHNQSALPDAFDYRQPNPTVEIILRDFNMLTRYWRCDTAAQYDSERANPQDHPPDSYKILVINTHQALLWLCAFERHQIWK